MKDNWLVQGLVKQFGIEVKQGRKIRIKNDRDCERVMRDLRNKLRK